jgi:putative Holliday junction resolvase
MARLLGIDYGGRRIGLAIGDDGLRIASPLCTIDGSGRVADDARAVLRRAEAEGATELVVGLPLNMDDSVGPQAELTRRFVAALRAAGPLAVHEQDERLTTYAADEALAAGGLTRRRRSVRRDKLAAQLILQAFFDRLSRT